MDPYIICCLLKKCGFDDVSKTVFERLKANLEIPTKISFDGTETQISYEELICGLPDNIFRLVKLFLSFIELCKFHRGGIIDEDNLIFNKNLFFNITHSLRNEIQIRSDLIDSVKYARSGSVYLTLRSFRLGTNDQLMFSEKKQVPFLSRFCGKFIRSNFVYAHQHFDDSEFGVFGEPASIYVVKTDKTGTVIITGGDDGMIRLWNALTGNLLTSIKKHTGDIIDIDINSCNALLASCCGKGQLIITLLSGNDWIPIAIIENTDRLTYVRFAYSKHDARPNKDDVFHESEMLISASDSAIITIYKVSDIFIHGVSHHLNLINRNEFPVASFKSFGSLFYQYENQVKSQNMDNKEKPLFYRAPPLYKIDIFPLSPKAFDICLNPFDHGFSSSESIKSSVFFSVGAALQSLSSTEEIQISISGNNVPTKFFTIQKRIDRQGYSLVFMIPFEHSQERIGIQLIEMPQNHGDHPDVSFANNSHDLVTASDDGTVIMWEFSRENIYNKICLDTYISDRIASGSYSKKKGISTKKVITEKSPNESLSEDDSDYVGSGPVDESSISRRNPLRTSRFIVKNDSLNQENNKSVGMDDSPNVVQFIDSVQWSCDDSIILIAQSVASKGMLRRNRNPALVSCIECCISYFSKSDGKRFLDIVLPNTNSRIACLIPHPISPGIVLSLAYNGTIFVTSNSKHGHPSVKLNKGSNVLFEHKNTKNPYLNGLWFKNGLGFVVSQKYGSFEIYNMCNKGDLNQQVLSQSYRFNFPEQFFLSDFSEISLDNTLGWIDTNLRKPIYMMPRPVIVDKNRVMYPEDVQPPIPMGSSLGVKPSSAVEDDILESRLPILSKYNNSPDAHKTPFSSSWIYLEGAKRRYIHRKKLIERARHLYDDAYMASNGSNAVQPRNTSASNVELTLGSSQNDSSSGSEEIQGYSSDSSNDEDFDINYSSDANSNRRLRAVSRPSPSASEGESSSSFDDSSMEENDYDSDLTSEDSLYDEIRGSLSNARSRRENGRNRLVSDTGFDIEETQKEIEFRYYALSNINTIWAPDCEEANNLVTCKLCNKSTTTILGYKYLIKSEIECNNQYVRPVLHGVNGSIDLGPLIGPFDYRYSTHKLERNVKFLLEEDSTNEGFYIHSRCLITIPYLQWELISDQIYTNLFDIIKRIYNPSEEAPPLPKNGLSSTFFDSKIVKFPKHIGVCSFCNEYGASILCQGNKCNRQFHYYCSSLIYHSFPESIDSRFISPRESNMYWCDIMQFYIFYCPKCISLKQSNVPYCPRRENMINNANSNHCNRSWLLTDQVLAGYAPQINDYLYFFPNAHQCSGIDDTFFKNIILEAAGDNRKPSRRSNKKLEFIKCKLVNISYAFPNDAEGIIKAILTFSTETNSGKRIHWQIRCTPNDGPDYLVLEDDVEKGIHNLDHRFRIGQENYIFIDGQWHEIMVKNIKQNAIWESIEISWKQDESDNSLFVSPWEIHETLPDVNSGQKNLDSYDDLIKIFSWITSQGEQNNTLSIIELFKYQVPFYSKKNHSNNEYSNQEWVMYYWKEIPLPFSFILIINRVRNNYYRRLESLVFDIFLVRSNCEHFNMNNNHLIQGIRYVEYELLRLIFSKRLPRYIIQTNLGTLFQEAEPEEQIPATNSSTFESDEGANNRQGRRTRRRI